MSNPTVVKHPASGELHPNHTSLVSPATSYAVLDPAIRDFLDIRQAAGKPSFYDLRSAEAKADLVSLQSNGHPIPNVGVSLYRAIAADGTRLAFHLVRPCRIEQRPPVILYVHGGGFIAGGWETHSRLVAELAIVARAVVAFLDYDLGPDARFPVPNHQAFLLAKLMAEQGGAFDLDGRRLAVAGDGAGASIAASVAWRALEGRGPHLLFQALFWPWAGLARPDRGDADCAWLSYLSFQALCERHFGDALGDPDALPARASFTRLEGMPPTLIITADHDVTRPGAEIYTRKLLQAGVDVVAARYVGTIHDFALLEPLSETPAARSAVSQAGLLLRVALAKKERA